MIGSSRMNKRELRAREFLELTQGDMNVEQYSDKFTELLLRYAPNSVPNEETKVERFLCGLQSKIRGRTICQGVNEYTKLVHQASIAERSVNYESAHEANGPHIHRLIRQRGKRLLVVLGQRSIEIDHNRIRVQGLYVQHVGTRTSVNAELQLAAVFSVAKLGTVPITVRYPPLKDKELRVQDFGVGNAAQAWLYSLTPASTEADT